MQYCKSTEDHCQEETYGLSSVGEHLTSKLFFKSGFTFNFPFSLCLLIGSPSCLNSFLLLQFFGIACCVCWLFCLAVLLAGHYLPTEDLCALQL